MKTMAKVKVELTHYSHKKGAEGGIGDVISVDQATADNWIANGGAKLVEDAKSKPTPAAQPPASTIDSEPPKSARTP